MRLCQPTRSVHVRSAQVRRALSSPPPTTSHTLPAPAEQGSSQPTESDGTPLPSAAPRSRRQHRADHAPSSGSVPWPSARAVPVHPAVVLRSRRPRKQTANIIVPRVGSVPHTVKVGGLPSGEERPVRPRDPLFPGPPSRSSPFHRFEVSTERRRRRAANLGEHSFNHQGDKMDR